nr:ribonuclease H-like domain, reverse transcriptase, RNA-dependent DNA polymerase [Tanacetum cinerariifolium]
MKARGTPLMALPNKDQLKFHLYQDAKLLMEAIEKRYGRNKESKKVQRTLLKKQYENFTASSLKTLDQTFDRSKVECFNCHKNGHFARECRAPKNQENRGREYGRKTVPVKNPTENALIAQDGIKGPPPYTGNYIPPKPDLMFIDEQVKSESMDVVSNVSSSAVKTVESKVESVDVKNKGVYSTVETKPVRKNNFSPLIIEDWNSDDERQPTTKGVQGKKVIDSGCSRHMTGNKCYLIDYKDYYGGFVSFRYGKGRISRKGKIKTGTVDFNDVYFCQAKKKKEPEQEYILIPICTTNPLFSQGPKDYAVDARKKATEVDESQVSDNGGQDNHVTRSEPSFVNVALPSPINAAGTPPSINAFEKHPFEQFSPFKNAFSLPRVPIVTPINDTGIFDNAYDDEVVEEEVDMNNVVSSYTILDAPLTKFFKDHPKDQNKARLVALGNTQEEGIDYDEVFTPVARIEAIRIFLAYASFKDFVVYQMDVNSAFLYGKIEEEFNRRVMESSSAKKNMPDITFAVCACVRFQVTPKTSHLHSVKRIFRYLKVIMLELALTVYKEWEDKMERAATTASSLEAEQDSDSDPKCQVTIFEGTKAQTRQSQMVMKRIERINELKNRKRDVVKKVNGQEQIQALVDKQKVIITEESIRRDLKFDDAEGTACLPNDTIFEELARMGSTMASAIICLANNQKFIFSKYIFYNMVKHLEGVVKFLMFPIFLQVFMDKQVEGMAKHKEIYVISSHTKKVFANMRRQGYGFSGNVTHLFETMMDNAQEEVMKVLDLEKAKTAQAKEIANLKKRVKKLENRRKSRPVGPRRLKKSIEDIDQDAEIALVDEAQGMMHDADLFGVDDLEGNEVIVDVREKIVEKEVSAADPVTTVASFEDSVAPTTAITIDVDEELTLEKTPIAIKAAKLKVISTAASTVTIAITTPRAKGIIFHKQVQAHIPTVSLLKYKGKAKMIEPKKPLKKKDQIALDEEVVRKLEAEMRAKMEEEERITREKDEANKAVIEEWDDVQAIIDADRQLAKQIQAQEREQLSIEERSKLLAELIESRRKYFAAKRAKEIRNKPPTKAQQKSIMCTYIRNIKGFKQKDFKGKSFDDINKFFNKVYKRVNTFVDMNTENVEDSLNKTQAEVTEVSFKRARQELEQESAKKQKLAEQEQAKVADDDTVELKRCLEIVLEDDVVIEATPLSSKSHIIVDYKIYRERKKRYFKIISADGNSQNYLTFGTMFKNFNREDLEVLRSIVKERFKKTKPVDDIENLLLQTLKTMFEPHVEDIIWKYQQGEVKVNK